MTKDQVIQSLLDNRTIIYIVSGEGEGQGTIEAYEGNRTIRALSNRLHKERSNGDRWAYPAIYHIDNCQYINLDKDWELL